MKVKSYLPVKSEELYFYDCPCTLGLKCSPALEAGLAGPVPCPWLALTGSDRLFSALFSFKVLSLRDLIQAHDFSSCKNHWPSTLQIHSKHTPKA